MTYRPDIDGLRAVAVLPVILYHAGLPVFRGGYVGVDVFFVISGYLITSILLAECAVGRFTLLGFYERRARRILPALFFVMACCLPFAWAWMPPEQLHEFFKSVAAVSLFASNVHFWRVSGYFDSAVDEKPLLHTWSLGVEEQFYILFPLLVAGLWKRFGRAEWRLIAVLAIASFACSEWAATRYPTGNFYLIPTRAWELLTGALVAFRASEGPLPQRVGRRYAQALSLTGLLLIAVPMLVYDEHTVFPGKAALPPVLGTALVLAFSARGQVVWRLLSQRGMVWVGLISYSAYLWHQPLLAFARIHSYEKPSIPLMATLCVATLVLAYLSWRYVEAPFRRRDRVPRRPLAILSLSGTALFLAVGLVGAQGNGFPSRMSEEAAALFRSAVPSPKREACHTHGPDYLTPAKACRYHADRVSWAVLGDSHMVEPAYALAGRLEREDAGLLHLSFSGCGPFLRVPSPQAGCTEWLEASLRFLETDAAIRNVVVGYRYSFYLFGDQLAAYPRVPDEQPAVAGKTPQEGRELFWQGFEEIIRRLRASGKRVFVLLPVPELGRSVGQNILAREFRRDPAYAAGTSRHYYEARHRFVLDRMRRLPWGENLVAVDPVSTLCDTARCYAILDGAAMYFDDNHLSVTGAQRVLATVDALRGD